MLGQNVYVIPGKCLTSIGIYRQVSFSTRKGHRAESQDNPKGAYFFVWNEKYR